MNTENKHALLALEDGTIYGGYSFGAELTVYGEVVFNTSMSGYQEMLTDPSYAGQIVVPTYPLIGNYGINQVDFESRQIWVRGFVVREYCSVPSHWQSDLTLHEFLRANGIPGLTGVDTRSLTRHLRSRGVMMGILTSEMTAEEALRELNGLPRYGSTDFVKEVAIKEPCQWGLPSANIQDLYNIVIVDTGLKYNIARILAQLGCRVTVVPGTMPAAEILALKKAAQILRTWYLKDTTLFVTLEPCPMCAYAMIQARIDRLVIGATDPKTGAAGSVINIAQNKKFNHQLRVTKNILNKECSLILKNFFSERR